MATNPDRASFFPAIEKKHGQPMTYWFGVMDEIKDRKYPEQMAYLQENYGFSRDARGRFGPPGFDDAAIDGIDQHETALQRWFLRAIAEHAPRRTTTQPSPHLLSRCMTKIGRAHV